MVSFESSTRSLWSSTFWESNEQFMSGKQSTTLEETFKNTWLLEICWRLSICLSIYIFLFYKHTSIHAAAIPSPYMTLHFIPLFKQI